MKHSTQLEHHNFVLSLSKATKVTHSIFKLEIQRKNLSSRAAVVVQRYSKMNILSKHNDLS